MDDIEKLKVLFEFIKTHGASGVLFVWICWDRFINPKLRKKKGEYVSWKDLKEKLDDDNRMLKHLERSFETERQVQIERDLKVESVRKRLDAFDGALQEMTYIFRNMSDGQKTLMRLVGEVKDVLKKD